MKNYIIGTAGHIDHGKTSLIKALTGTDTDRLAEEKKRGISIVLGYAGFILPSGAFAGIIDVPGHAKFVKTMVSGSSGMDIVIFVIAADDGIKLQTEEHLLILKLLDIKVIIPVLTKIDLADEEAVLLRESEIKGFFDRYSVPVDEIIKVSSKTKEGIETLVKKIDAKIASLNFTPASTKTFLPVDRVFTLKGFGTVLTGTLMYGRLKVNDEIEIMPEGIVTKIKSMESHNKSIPVAKRSMRTAINVTSVQKEDINPGDIVSLKGSLFASDTILCSLFYAENNKKDLKPKNLSNLIFMAGSANLSARVIIPDKNRSKKIAPGTRLTVVIKLEGKISAICGEKFIVRDPGMLETVGGGTIIDPFFDHDYDNSKEGLYQGMISNDPLCAVLSFISLDGNSANLSKIYKKMNFSYGDFMSYITELIKSGRIAADEKLKFAVLKENIEDLERSIEKRLGDLIDKDRLKTGIPKNELYSYYDGIMDISIFDMILNGMISKGVIVSSGGNISIKGAAKELSEENKKLMDKIEILIKSSGNSVPFVPDIEKKLDINKKTLNNLIGIMVGEGRLVRVKYDILYLKEQIDKIKKDLESFFSVNDRLEPKDIKEIAGVSRKYAIPLLEYFDASGFTIKKDGHRVKGAVIPK